MRFRTCDRLASFHSRADGNVHGVTSLCEADGDLLVGAKGSGLVVSLPLQAAGRARMTNLIELKQVTKDFRGVPAIKDVDFAIQGGEIHAILGENGAGKSTLMKVMAGVYQPSAGTMLLDGKPIVLKSPSDALNHGIAMVYQETNLVPSMTVAQNIYLGRERLFNRLRGLNIYAQRFLLSLNFYVDPTVQVSTLGCRQEADGRDRPRRPSQCAASSSSTSRPRRSRRKRSSTSSILRAG